MDKKTLETVSLTMDKISAKSTQFMAAAGDGDGDGDGQWRMAE